MLKNPNKNNLKNQSQKKLNAYAKYSSMALQMGFIITLGTFGGLKIDQYFNLNFPIFTLILSIASVIIAVYLAIKDIINYNK